MFKKPWTNSKDILKYNFLKKYLAKNVIPDSIIPPEISKFLNCNINAFIWNGYYLDCKHFPVNEQMVLLQNHTTYNDEAVDLINQHELFGYAVCNSMGLKELSFLEKEAIQKLKYQPSCLYFEDKIQIKNFQNVSKSRVFSIPTRIDKIPDNEELRLLFFGSKTYFFSKVQQNLPVYFEKVKVKKTKNSLWNDFFNELHVNIRNPVLEMSDKQSLDFLQNLKQVEYNGFFIFKSNLVTENGHQFNGTVISKNDKNLVLFVHENQCLIMSNLMAMKFKNFDFDNEKTINYMANEIVQRFVFRNMKFIPSTFHYNKLWISKQVCITEIQKRFQVICTDRYFSK